MAAPLPRRFLVGAAGSRAGAFGPTEWSLVVGVGLVWGASFLFIAEGLEAFPPALVAFIRLSLGTLTLAAFPRARQPIERGDWPTVAALGTLWMAIPFTLFPIAQQWVDSSVAGMINGCMPVLTAAVAAVVFRLRTAPGVVAGIAVGFAGVLLVSLPNAVGGRARPLGVTLLLLAVLLYAVASNLTVPLQQRYGALPVILRAQLVAVALTGVAAAITGRDVDWQWSSAAAMVPLGALGSGFAFIAFATLLGRAGAARGAIAIYLVPGVAIALGVVLRNESVEPLAVVGSALIIVGAWITGSRADADTPRARP